MSCLSGRLCKTITHHINCNLQLMKSKVGPVFLQRVSIFATWIQKLTKDSHVIVSDIDECESSLRSNNCSINALCTNTEGSYICRCGKGYEGDGRNCKGKYMIYITQMIDVIVFKQTLSWIGGGGGLGEGRGSTADGLRS